MVGVFVNNNLYEKKPILFPVSGWFDMPVL